MNGAMKDLRETLAQRIQKARERLGLTQQELAVQAGFSVHQIISQIERCERDIKAWELANLAKALRIEVADLLRATAEPKALPAVLWREFPKEAQIKEADFLKRCQQYNEVEKLCGIEEEYDFPQKQVDLGRMTFEDAMKLALHVSREFNLGSRPALALENTLQDRFRVKVWYQDLGDEGSAASTYGDFGPAILMNSKEAPWRRNYNFAHEVFHLITWSSIPAERLRQDQKLWEYTEKLANVFASNFLLPGEEILLAFNERIKDGKISYLDLVGLARKFDVSTNALLYRLLNLKRLNQRTIDLLKNDATFKALDRGTMVGKWWIPPPIPERFVRLSFLAYQKGKLSRMKLAEYLNTSLIDLTDTLCQYGLNDRADYETEIRAYSAPP